MSEGCPSKMSLDTGVGYLDDAVLACEKGAMSGRLSRAELRACE